MQELNNTNQPEVSKSESSPKIVRKISLKLKLMITGVIILIIVMIVLLITNQPNIGRPQSDNVLTDNNLIVQDTEPINVDLDWQSISSEDLGISLSIPAKWESRIEENGINVMLYIMPDSDKSHEMFFAAPNRFDSVCNGPAWAEDDRESEGVKIVFESITIEGKKENYILCLENGTPSLSQVILEVDGLNSWNEVVFFGTPNQFGEIEKKILESVKYLFKSENSVKVVKGDAININDGFISANIDADRTGFYYTNISKKATRQIISFTDSGNGLLEDYQLVGGDLYFRINETEFVFNLEKQLLKNIDKANCGKDCSNIVYNKDGSYTYLVTENMEDYEETLKQTLKIVQVVNNKETIIYSIPVIQFQGGVSNGMEESVMYNPKGDKLLVFSDFYDGSFRQSLALILDNKGLLKEFAEIDFLGWINDNEVYYQKDDVIRKYNLNTKEDSLIVETEYQFKISRANGTKITHSSDYFDNSKIGKLYLLDLASKTDKVIAENIYSHGWIDDNRLLVSVLDYDKMDFGKMGIFDINTKEITDFNFFNDNREIRQYNLRVINSIQPYGLIWGGSPFNLE